MKFEKLMPKFEEWYATQRFPVETRYSQDITRENLETISDEELVNFFTKFAYEGGGIQDQGYRNSGDLNVSIRENPAAFREHILKPFEPEFDVNFWRKEKKQENFSGWGPGIATIYLVHINKYKFSILNGKTLRVAANLIPRRYLHRPAGKTYKGYQETHNIQLALMDRYPNIDNFIKADGFFEYLNRHVAPEELSTYWTEAEANKFIELIEEKEIRELIYDEPENSPKKLIRQINKLAQTDSEEIEYGGKRYKRNMIVTEKIKKLRNYTCQFCGMTILKKDGTRYIEACHIKEKCKGGPETLTNILILCPNCHKEFDYGLREKEERPAANIYQVLLNGKERMAEFETPATRD